MILITLKYKKEIWKKLWNICKTPKVRALPIPDLTKCAEPGPFRSVYTCKHDKRNFKTYIEDIHVTLNEC